MSSDTIEIQAAVCRAFGEPLSIETLQLDPPARGEVRVRVLASSICHSDITYIDGGWGGNLPAVFGHEVAGVVTGHRPRPCDRTICTRVIASWSPCCARAGTANAARPASPASARRNSRSIGYPGSRTRRAGRCAPGLRVGGFAESVVVDASQVVKIPENIADETACLISCGVMTGFGAAINTAGVQVGGLGRGHRLRGSRTQLRSGRGAGGRVPAGRDRRDRGEVGAGEGIRRDGDDQRHGRRPRRQGARTDRRTRIRRGDDCGRERARHGAGASSVGARRCAGGGGDAAG